MTWQPRPKFGPVRPCGCGCGIPLHGMQYTAKYRPECLSKVKYQQRGQRPPYVRKIRLAPAGLCKECYGLALDRGIDCPCLHAEAAE